jgi:glutaredoxin 3
VAYPDHVYHNVRSDRGRLQEMLAHSGGRRQVSVIVASGRVSLGYGGS